MAEVEHVRQVRTADNLNILTGIFMVVAPGIMNFGSTGLMWSSILTGIVIVVLEATQETMLRTVWQSWVSVVAGLWAIVAPFIFGGATGAAVTAGVVAGLLAIGFGAWSAMASADDPMLRA